jgi:methionyl-tRNA formyltransferase
MRVLFMGSPEFALPSLKALSQNHDVLAVFTQPDLKAGRGMKLQPSPVKILASRLDLTVYQPDSFKDQTTIDLILQLDPDVIVVAAYGKILPFEILSIPKVACINVHASLLPRWRGAAPVQAAILAGDELTGISIMQMDPGLDTGPVYVQESTRISSTETGGELINRLAELGATTLLKALPAIYSGELPVHNQVDDDATYAPMLKKSDGLLDFVQPAIDLARQVRAYEPWPSSFFHWNKKRIVVRAAEAVDVDDLPPGACLEYNRLPAVAADPGVLVLHTVQPAGKNQMSGDIFLIGAKDFRDGRITNTSDAKS